MPVTTTRLIATPFATWRYRTGKSGRGLVDIFHGVADGQDRLGSIVGNFDTELLFEGHDEFHRIQTVGAQIIDEARTIGDLLSIDAEMLDNNLLDALGGVTHLGILVSVRVSSLAARMALIKLKDGCGRARLFDCRFLRKWPGTRRITRKTSPVQDENTEFPQAVLPRRGNIFRILRSSPSRH
jgi:hypothetical protein